MNLLGTQVEGLQSLVWEMERKHLVSVLEPGYTANVSFDDVQDFLCRQRQCCVCDRVPRTSENTHRLRYCASCRNRHRYCDSACQRLGWNEHKVECRMTCSRCKNISASNLPRCPCEKRRYCNTRCQKLDWDAKHSLACSISWPVIRGDTPLPPLIPGYLPGRSRVAALLREMHEQI
jgi:hypothetical protein